MTQPNAKYDITGQTFGMLTAKERVDGVNTTSLWRCLCACGREKIVSYRNLAYGKTRSCGCTRASGRIRDLTGQRFGRLVAQERLSEQRDGSYLWRCLCDCGSLTAITANALIKGQTKSCGCLAIEAKRAMASNLKGMRFGRLTAVEPTENRSKNGGVIWRCVCDCGKESFQIASVLRNGSVTSCGCKHVENVTLQRSLDYVDGTCVQFLQSDKLRSDNTSGVRGVSAYKGKWRARINFKKKAYELGVYENIEEAIQVRKKAESVLYGEFLDWYNDAFPKKQEIEPVEPQNTADNNTSFAQVLTRTE